MARLEEMSDHDVKLSKEMHAKLMTGPKTRAKTAMAIEYMETAKESDKAYW